MSENTFMAFCGLLAGMTIGLLVGFGWGLSKCPAPAAPKASHVAASRVAHSPRAEFGW